MKEKHDETIIGYSGFILYEDCYEYSEDACYLADSIDSAKQFMIDCGHYKSDFRIDEISISKLLTDFGCSCGEFAMEKLAFEKFKQIADEKDIKYECEDFYLDSNIKVVNL